MILGMDFEPSPISYFAALVNSQHTHIEVLLGRAIRIRLNIVFLGVMYSVLSTT